MMEKYQEFLQAEVRTRPNRIGLTVVELLKVEENVLHVKGLDAINGTPVLDIKPYIKKIEENSEESKLNKNIQTEKTTNQL